MRPTGIAVSLKDAGAPLMPDGEKLPERHYLIRADHEENSGNNDIVSNESRASQRQLDYGPGRRVKTVAIAQQR